MKTLNFKSERSSLNNSRFKAVVCFLAIMLVCTGCHDNLGPKTGTILCGDETYSISIGEISKNDAGYTLVSIVGDMPGLMIIRNGSLYPFLGVRIIAGGTVEYQAFSVKEGEYTYSFSTKKDPERIIVYSLNGGTETLIFDGKTKTIIE